MFNKLAVLSREDCESFIENGYVIVQQAFRRETALQLAKEVWQLLPEDEFDKSTWSRPSAELKVLIDSGPVADIFTERYMGAVDDLVGKGRWHTNERSFGWVPVRFPKPSGSSWKPPLDGWHVDGIDFIHYINSRELGLAGMEFMTTIRKGGGGTALKVGSHKFIANLLAKKKDSGISYKELMEISNNTNTFPVVEANGEGGDVLWMHPFLIHARSENSTPDVRIAANRSISMNQSIDPWRSDSAELSILELSIRKALS